MIVSTYLAMKQDEIKSKLINLKPVARKILDLAANNPTIVSNATISKLAGISDSQTSGTLAALGHTWLDRVDTTPEGKAVFSLKESVDREILKKVLIELPSGNP